MKKRILLICVLCASLSSFGYAQKAKSAAPKRGAKPPTEQKDFQDNKKGMPRPDGPMPMVRHGQGPGMPPPPPPPPPPQVAPVRSRNLAVLQAPAWGCLRENGPR